jgi:hypothetical protein
VKHIVAIHVFQSCVQKFRIQDWQFTVPQIVPVLYPKFLDTRLDARYLVMRSPSVVLLRIFVFSRLRLAVVRLFLGSRRLFSGPSDRRPSFSRVTTTFSRLRLTVVSLFLGSRRLFWVRLTVVRLFLGSRRFFSVPSDRRPSFSRVTTPFLGPSDRRPYFSRVTTTFFGSVCPSSVFFSAPFPSFSRSRRLVGGSQNNEEARKARYYGINNEMRLAAAEER